MSSRRQGWGRWQSWNKFSHHCTESKALFDTWQQMLSWFTRALRVGVKPAYQSTLRIQRIYTMGEYLADERAVAMAAVRTACAITTKVFKTLTSDESVTKKDKSPVTIGDFSAQAAVNYILKKHFPQDNIVAEETSTDLQGDAGKSIRDKVSQLVNEALQTSGDIQQPLSDDDILSSIDQGAFEGGSDARFWTLDPIDGTKGFLRGGQYAVCLALIVNGRIELGVMGCPNLPRDVSQSKPKDGDIRHSSMEGLGVLFVAARGHGAFVAPINDTEAPLEPIHMRDLE